MVLSFREYVKEKKTIETLCYMPWCYRASFKWDVSNKFYSDFKKSPVVSAIISGFLKI